MNVKTASDIRIMERTCQLAAQTLVHVSKFVKAGVTTNELDQIAYDYTLSHNARPAPLNYHGFPKSICTSVNYVICHGVPNNVPLKDGDIVNIDVTTFKDGFHGDCSATYFVGNVSHEARLIVEVAEKARDKGIEAITPFGTTGDIGYEINKYVTRKGFAVVHEIGGHGIGREFHEEPFVPSYGKKGRGDKLLPWGTITVEPMININDRPIKEFSIPGSTIKYYETSDKTLSAQFEHTVLITDKGYQILTLP
ncbi:MAG: type I methionyl aminopeptidase [Bdellovibrionales bacterium]|nr:type I methionyl aminopeptidase [Bdellovibrionales bacterium]